MLRFYTLLARRRRQASVIHSSPVNVSRALLDDVPSAALSVSSLLTGRQRRCSTSSRHIIITERGQRRRQRKTATVRAVPRRRPQLHLEMKTLLRPFKESLGHDVLSLASAVAAVILSECFPARNVCVSGDKTGFSPLTPTVRGVDRSVSVSRHAETVYHN